MKFNVTLRELAGEGSDLCFWEDEDWGPGPNHLDVASIDEKCDNLGGFLRSLVADVYSKMDNGEFENLEEALDHYFDCDEHVDEEHDAIVETMNIVLRRLESLENVVYRMASDGK